MFYKQQINNKNGKQSTKNNWIPDCKIKNDNFNVNEDENENKIIETWHGSAYISSDE